MAKHFGRNQRRRLLDRVAALEREVDELRYAGWRRADGSDIALLSIGRQLSYSICENLDRRHCACRARVELAVRYISEQAWIALRGGGLVEWDNLKWRVRQVQVDSKPDYLSMRCTDDFERWEVELDAVPARPLPVRQRQVR